LIGCRLDVDCFAASARDPFGNLMCLIHSPNFKLADERQAGGINLLVPSRSALRA
jgi:hypothetical protein